MADTEYTREQIEAVRQWFIEKHACWFTSDTLREMFAVAALPSASLGEQLAPVLTHDEIDAFYEAWEFSEEDPGRLEFHSLVRETEYRVLARVAASPASKSDGGGGEAPEARRERLIANGYKTDSRCTWLAIGRCAECGRAHDGKSLGVLACTTPDHCRTIQRCANVGSGVAPRKCDTVPAGPLGTSPDQQKGGRRCEYALGICVRPGCAIECQAMVAAGLSADQQEQSRGGEQHE